MKIPISQGFIFIISVILMITLMAFAEMKNETNNLDGMGIGFIIGMITILGVLTMDRGWIYDTKKKKFSEFESIK